MNKAEIQKQIDKITENFRCEIDILKTKLDSIDEFKAGDWAVVTQDHKQNGEVIKLRKHALSHCLPFQSIRMDGSIGDGFDHNHLRRATTEEIKEALVKEAIRRGYKHGTIVIRPYGTVRVGLDKSLRTKYKPEIDRLEYMGVHVYDEGKWAEIVEDKITINGYDAEIFNKTVDVGCKKDILHESFKTINGYINHFDLEIYREGENITEQIKKIAERINEG